MIENLGILVKREATVCRQCGNLGRPCVSSGDARGLRCHRGADARCGVQRAAGSSACGSMRSGRQRSVSACACAAAACAGAPRAHGPRDRPSRRPTAQSSRCSGLSPSAHRRHAETQRRTRPAPRSARCVEHEGVGGRAGALCCRGHACFEIVFDANRRRRHASPLWTDLRCSSRWCYPGNCQSQHGVVYGAPWVSTCSIRA